MFSTVGKCIAHCIHTIKVKDFDPSKNYCISLVIGLMTKSDLWSKQSLTSKQNLIGSNGYQGVKLPTGTPLTLYQNKETKNRYLTPVVNKVSDL